MSDINKVIRGWERCKKCTFPSILDNEGNKAYLECEYTTGLYCRRDKLIDDTIYILTKSEEEIRKLASWAKASGIDVNALLGRKVVEDTSE